MPGPNEASNAVKKAVWSVHHGFPWFKARWRCVTWKRLSLAGHDSAPSHRTHVSTLALHRPLQITHACLALP